MKSAGKDRSKKSKRRKARVNFQRVPYHPNWDTVFVRETGHREAHEREWDDFDMILGNFGDWGDH
jgi:hypothetical protein